MAATPSIDPLKLRTAESGLRFQLFGQKEKKQARSLVRRRRQFLGLIRERAAFLSSPPPSAKATLVTCRCPCVPRQGQSPARNKSYPPIRSPWRNSEAKFQLWVRLTSRSLPLSGAVSGEGYPGNSYHGQYELDSQL